MEERKFQIGDKVIVEYQDEMWKGIVLEYYKKDYVVKICSFDCKWVTSIIRVRETDMVIYPKRDSLLSRIRKLFEK